MDVKVRANEVYKITKNMPCEQLYIAMTKLLNPDEMVFAKYSVGNGFYKWILPAGVWTRLSDADGFDEEDVRSAIIERKSIVKTKLNMSDNVLENIFTTPDDSFIFYNIDAENRVNIVLTGWDYKYPIVPKISGGGGKSEGKKIQDVYVVFVEAGHRVTNFEFTLKSISGRNKKFVTGIDDRCYLTKHKIGTTFDIMGITRPEHFTLEVVEGKSEYEFDVTRSSIVEVCVVKDENPVAGKQVSINYNDNVYSLITDLTGRVSLNIPYLENILCQVAVDDKSQMSVVRYPMTSFVFKSETNVPRKPDEPEKSTDIVVKVTKDGNPAVSMALNLSVGDNSYVGETDCNGFFVQQVVYGKDTVAVVVVQGKEQRKPLEFSSTEFVFELNSEKKPLRVLKPHIKVEGKEGFIGKIYPLEVEINGIKTRYVTDDKGLVQLEENKEGVGMTIIDGLVSDNVQNFILDADQEEYIFKIPYGYISGDSDIKIMVRDVDNRPISHASIDFFQSGHNVLAYLGDDGIVYFNKDDFEYNVPIKVTLTCNGKDFQPVNFQLEEDENEYLLQVEGEGASWYARIFELVLVIASVVGLAVLWDLYSDALPDMWSNFYYSLKHVF